MPRVIAFLLLLIMLQVSSALAGDYFCFGFYDKFRNIKYWGKVYLSINNLHFKSNVVEGLGLAREIQDGTVKSLRPNKIIYSHFKNEFGRFIKGNWPYHDVQAKLKPLMNKFLKEHLNDRDWWEKWDAYEESIIRSTYGPNPGGVFCSIEVKRKKFPVLYRIRCSLVANATIRNKNGLEEEDFGYGTPETIGDELNVAITQCLTKLSEKMKRINSCPDIKQ